MSGSALKRVLDLGFPWQTADPFLFCVHHEDHFPRGNGQMGPDASLAGRNLGMDFEIRDGWRMYHGERIPGFPAHPHRGFETITVVTRGFVDHADSLGAAGRYGEGDTQWMTAGRGVQHSEMFPLLNDEAGNELELFQIWINLPARNKMTEPHFAMLWNEDVPVYRHEDSAGRVTEVNLIAGRLEDLQAPPPPPASWAADAANEVAVWTLCLEPGAEWTLPAASPGLNRCLYVYRGSLLTVEGQTIRPQQGAVLHSDQAARLRAGEDVTWALMLQGRPIAEPFASHGPFVMNTEQEIHQAFADFRRDEFGGWPWPDRDQVHAKDRGRFARFADGTEITPTE
ncbi:pirin family protein [Natronospirillum operosum]|uniref:Pirin family protein n=1 Tax=Natronospirillum operosum TaxID=2759953 RepID=A0A4Z0WB16_9GAMM|nr:pirin family protein [Natronospirillum operosum]TGG90723.1 pirin family protein [Natronospirillum operosum]